MYSQPETVSQRTQPPPLEVLTTSIYLPQACSHVLKKNRSMMSYKQLEAHSHSQECKPTGADYHIPVTTPIPETNKQTQRVHIILTSKSILLSSYDAEAHLSSQPPRPCHRPVIKLKADA
jgi:hypothetical protein